MQRTDIEEVAHETFRVRGSIVNWYLVRDGRDLTLVDAGYPGNTADVESSIRLVGHDPRDVRALLITHAHADHIGAAEHLDAAFGVPAYCSAAEVAHARRERRQQVTPAQVVANAWRPGVLPWALRAVRLGGTSRTAVPHAQPFPGDGPLDLPGGPVPVPTPGHTDGHSAFFLPTVGAVLTGDGLVTGHPTSRRSGPQLLPAFFNHQLAATAAALAPLARLDADLLLPGHGDPWQAYIADAVAIARHGVWGERLAGGGPVLTVWPRWSVRPAVDGHSVPAPPPEDTVTPATTGSQVMPGEPRHRRRSTARESWSTAV